MTGVLSSRACDGSPAAATGPRWRATPSPTSTTASAAPAACVRVVAGAGAAPGRSSELASAGSAPSGRDSRRGDAVGRAMALEATRYVVDRQDIWHGMWAGSLPRASSSNGAIQNRAGTNVLDDSRLDISSCARGSSPDSAARGEQPGSNGPNGDGHVVRILALTVNDPGRRPSWRRDSSVPRGAAGSSWKISPQVDSAHSAALTSSARRWACTPTPRSSCRTKASWRWSVASSRRWTPSSTFRRPSSSSWGSGHLEKRYADEAARPPDLGRVLVHAGSCTCTEVCSPGLRLPTSSRWPSSRTTLNHRYTTPQKLFESMAAGVPVAASDLPGMAQTVRATGAGVVCDPTSPHAIAEAIKQVIRRTSGRTAQRCGTGHSAPPTSDTTGKRSWKPCSGSTVSSCRRPCRTRGNRPIEPPGAARCRRPMTAIHRMRSNGTPE